MTIVYYKLYQTVYSHSCLLIIYGFLKDKKYINSLIYCQTRPRSTLGGLKVLNKNSTGVSWK